MSPPQKSEATERLSLTSTDGIELSAIWRRAEVEEAAVVLAHGIQSDKSEDGLFDRVADRLGAAHISALRFDFRGHGESTGRQEDVTLTGERADLECALGWVRSQSSGPLGLLAASFGAVTGVCVALDAPDITTLVLWNPVLDLVQTFLKPTLPWASRSFNDAGFESVARRGYLLMDDNFRIGAGLVDEMRESRPLECLSRLEIPVLTLHGDADTYVPYWVSEQFGRPNSDSQFVRVPGSEHGFGRPEDARLAIDRTVDWMTDHLLPRPRPDSPQARQ